MNYAKKRLPGIMISAAIAIIAYIISSFLPAGILGGTLIALILGMLLNPLLCKYEVFDTGLKWTSKIILRVGIILAGITLSFPQVLKAGKYALILMFF
ncbi:MAG TPA: putative sulfate exporter family transporter, partial [Clostridiales bacterium]|nr:putative sulfate exporter family transporter [Clostridiales bacterium]